MTIHGQRWWGMAEARAHGMRMQGGVEDRTALTPTPDADGDTRTMLNTLVYAPDGNLNVALPFANGDYQVYVWALENYRSDVRSWNLALEGQTVGRDLGLLPLKRWTNYGPFAATVRDGVLNLDLWKGSGSPLLSGFAVYQHAADPTPAPPAPTPIATPQPAPPPTQPPAPTQPPSAPADYPSFLVETFAHDLNPTDPWMKPWMRLTNTGDVPVSLKDVTVRYWYQADGAGAESYVCDYARVGCWNLRGRVVRLAAPRAGADSYLEISFTEGAGQLAPGASTGDIQHRLNQRNWHVYDERNDWSYTPAAAWTRSDTITVYLRGQRVAGREP